MPKYRDGGVTIMMIQWFCIFTCMVEDLVCYFYTNAGIIVGSWGRGGGDVASRMLLRPYHWTLGELVLGFQY